MKRLVFTPFAFFFGAAFLFFSIPINAQDIHSFQWTYSSENAFPIQTYDAVNTSDGGYILTGLLDFSMSHYPYILKVDCEGQPEWSRFYNAATESFGNSGGRIVRTTDDNYVVLCTTGYYLVTPAFSVTAIKFDDSGEIIWSKQIGSDATRDQIRSVEATADGGVIFAGQTASIGSDANSGSYFDQLFVKLDMEGEIEWSTSVGNPEAIDRAYGVVQNDDGSYAACGSYLHNGTFHGNLLKLSTEGELEWNKGIGESIAPHATHSYGFSRLADGGYLLTGSTTRLEDNFTSWSDVLAVRTDAVGDTLWTRVIKGGASDSFENGTSTLEDAAGNLHIMAATNSYPTIGFVGNKYVIHSFDPGGTFIGSKYYNQGSSHYPVLKANTYEGGFFITGFTNWTEYGGDGNIFQPILVNLNEDLNVSGDCFSGDVSNLTSVFNPSMEFGDIPSVTGNGITSSEVELEVNTETMEFSNLCEESTGCELVGTDDSDTAAEGLVVFPNPASVGQTIRFDGDTSAPSTSVLVFDAQGKCVFRMDAPAAHQPLEWQAQESGIYLLRFNTRNGPLMQRIIVQ